MSETEKIKEELNTHIVTLLCQAVIKLNFEVNDLEYRLAAAEAQISKVMTLINQ